MHSFAERELARVLSVDGTDVDAVHALAASCFPTPWDREVFLEELDREWAYLRVVRMGPTASIVAFVSFWIVRDEIHVLSLGTHPSKRRRGYARLLMGDVLNVAREHSARYVSLEVRRGNAAAISLYRGLGFRSIGVRPRYYADDAEDAVVMLRTLSAPAP